MKSVLMMTIMALIVLLKMMMLDDDDVDDDDGFDGNHLQRNVSANVWRPVMWRANLNILPFQNHHHVPSHWYNSIIHSLVWLKQIHSIDLRILMIRNI